MEQHGLVDWCRRNAGNHATLSIRELRGWWRGETGKRIADLGHALDARQAVPHQAVQRTRRELQLPQQMVDGRRAAEGLDRLVDGAAFGRALEAPVALEQRLQPPPPGPPPFSRRTKDRP